MLHFTGILNIVTERFRVYIKATTKETTQKNSNTQRRKNNMSIGWVIVGLIGYAALVTTPLLVA